MAGSKGLRIPLRIVFYRETDRWIAHGLEFDLIGDGGTKQEALACLSDAIHLQVEASLENKNPANLFSPADSKYFLMFARGTDVVSGVLKLGELQDSVTMIDDVMAREYEESESALVFA